MKSIDIRFDRGQVLIYNTPAGYMFIAIDKETDKGAAFVTTLSELNDLTNDLLIYTKSELNAKANKGE